MASLECQGFLFYSNFDSGNLARVECVPRNESVVVPVNKNGKDVPEIPDIEFNLWTKPDCMGTEFENGNRTWFHFGVKGYLPSVLMKLNLVDLNRQAKMYSQGMAPVYRLVPGKPNWERIRDKPTYMVTDNVFTLSFKFKTPENIDTIMFFAFTYPYTYTELQASLINIDQRFLTRMGSPSGDDIYYVRELLCKSLENRRVDLITITSFYNIATERETRLKFLFPEENKPRPFKFKNKKVIFISARVHPGETPSSFVFNGLLNFLLNREDPIACMLRRMYVFKMIPFLNPDGVAKGHYRTDTRGINLNRVYLCPTLAEHPSVFAARSLIQYYHTGTDQGSEIETFSNETSFTIDNNSMTQQVEVLSLEEKNDTLRSNSVTWKQNCEQCNTELSEENHDVLEQKIPSHSLCSKCLENNHDSGLFMYLDMHGHASKKGIFMYGNHFNDVERNIECMLLPKIMSLNNYNFHFTACNFTERNMYLRDRRDGMSREGSGRVAVLKLTGLVRSYTLECNYNSGRMVNVLPPSVKETTKNMHTLPLPPKYTPQVFEEVGRSIGASILDLTGSNPNSRIPNSEFHNLNGLRDWIRMNCLHDTSLNRISMRNSKLQAAQNQNSSKPMRCRSMKTLGMKARPSTVKSNKKAVNKSASYAVDRKENLAFRSREQIAASNSSSSYSASSSCSRIFNRSASKSKGLSLRAKSKPSSNQHCNKTELSNRSVQTSNTSIDLLGQSKSESTSRPVTKQNSKRIKVTPEIGPDRLKLREICFIKENLTKKIIAKFSSTDSNNEETYDDDDDLVVAWDPTYSPKILSRHASRPTSSRICKPGTASSIMRPGSSSVRPGSSSVRPGNSMKGRNSATNKPSSSNRLPNTVYESSTSNPNIKSSFKSTSFRGKPRKSKGSLKRLTVTNIDSAGKIDKMKKRKKIIKKLL